MKQDSEGSLDLTIQSKSIKKKDKPEGEVRKSTTKKRIYEVPAQSSAMMDIMMRRPVIERYYQEDGTKIAENTIKEGSISKALHDSQ